MAIPQAWQAGLPGPRYKVELIVEGKKHLYRVWAPEEEVSAAGEPTILPGVTGTLSIINKPALVNWSKRVAIESVQAALLKHTTKTGRISLKAAELEEILKVAGKNPDKLKDDAADLGTRAHEYIDTIVRGESPRNIPDEILTPVSAFAEWYRGSGIEFVAGDTKVASLAHGYGGSLDALGIRDSSLILLDWKTAKAIYDDYALQVAAYVRAFEEMYGVAIEEAWCVRFRKPGVKGPAFEAVRVRDVEASFQAFLEAKRLTESMKIEHFIR